MAEYSVKVIDRIKSILGDDYEITPDDTLEYSWSGGYEKVIVRHHGTQSGMEYAGVYHPGDGSCVGNPCNYCGITW